MEELSNAGPGRLRADGIAVQVRTNFTAMLEPGNDGLSLFFQQNEVQLVGSMPCYLEENVDAQRGPGTYSKSIEVIRRLNALGYGRKPELVLNLVYNPLGPQLPPPQEHLESDYRRELGRRYGIAFTHLLTITNMPIGRFRAHLRTLNKEQEYMDLLVRSFNPETLDGLMCRRQISIGWSGTLYDCDFNIALGIPVNHGVSCDLNDFDVSALARRQIATGDHCFGCTAGHGSSCRGALIAGTQGI
jgi:radical SAM/Cys-rich protein